MTYKSDYTLKWLIWIFDICFIASRSISTAFIASSWRGKYDSPKKDKWPFFMKQGKMDCNFSLSIVERPCRMCHKIWRSNHFISRMRVNQLGPITHWFSPILGGDVELSPITAVYWTLVVSSFLQYGHNPLVISKFWLHIRVGDRFHAIVPCCCLLWWGGVQINGCGSNVAYNKKRTDIHNWIMAFGTVHL